MRQLLTVVSALVLCAVVLAPRPVTAQVSAADAAPYIGTWTLHMVGQALGLFDMGLKIVNDGGKVAAEIVSGPLGQSKSTGVVRRDKELTLKFTFDYMGSALDGAVILEPEGAKYKATISVMEGGFLIPGEATKN